MKTRLLHDVDLARIATLPESEQWMQLRQIRHTRPPLSYAPLRSCLHDILNVQPTMFGPVTSTDWRAVEAELNRKCRSADELKANREVARSLHDFATQNKLFGRAQDFFPLALGAGRKVQYWLPIVLAVDGYPLVPFIDPRRSRGLTREARRFVFSMMHEHIRMSDPDYADVRLGIFQFPVDAEGARAALLHKDDGMNFFSFDELEGMVSTTYELWEAVLDERETEARRRGSGTSGPLI